MTLTRIVVELTLIFFSEIETIYSQFWILFSSLVTSRMINNHNYTNISCALNSIFRTSHNLIYEVLSAAPIFIVFQISNLWLMQCSKYFPSHFFYLSTSWLFICFNLTPVKHFHEFMWGSLIIEKVIVKWAIFIMS